MRKSFLVLAFAALAMCVAGELGGGLWLVKPEPPASWSSGPHPEVVSATGRVSPGMVDDAHARIDAGPSRRELARPGLGIPYLALVDVLLLVTVAFITAGLLLPERALAAAHAVTALVVSLLVLLASVLGFFAALGLTLAMVGLFLACPFGTAVYLALWGSFPVGAAAATLGVLLVLKLVYGAGLLVASPRFLENRGLVFLSAVSLAANVLVAFLHGLPPGILASVTDGVAAIVVAVLALICGVVVLVWSIIALVRLVVAARLAVT